MTKNPLKLREKIKIRSYETRGPRRKPVRKKILAQLKKSTNINELRSALTGNGLLGSQEIVLLANFILQAKTKKLARLHDVAREALQVHGDIVRNASVHSESQKPPRAKSKHFQVQTYEAIVNGDIKQFAREGDEEISKRIHAINKAYENFPKAIKPYANFNKRFFISLLNRDMPRDIKLVDREGHFRWPSTFAYASESATNTLDVDANSQGVLLAIGYSVAEGGPSDFQRREVLARFFEGQIKLPNLGRTYLDEWSAPKTAARLRKMAYSIAAFCRNQKRRKNPSLQAIQKWEADLAFLKSRYYSDLSNRFNWPHS